MNLTIPILFALTAAVCLLLLGYRLGQQSTAVAIVDDVAVCPAWLDRAEAVEQLRALRSELELDGRYDKDEALLLFDVASYLALEPGEMQAVIGVAWFDYLEEPADVGGLAAGVDYE